jgi:UDP-N-acetylglucosamine--N-acetylmuramyl-(pentapeptide) pyrophosphoryl-undecaprenol N-acetylglucosamine transferase
MPVVLIAGGGTGGHLMPALAIADAIVAADSRFQPYFVGAERGLEAKVLPGRPWPYTLLPFEPIYRKQWWKNAALPLTMWRSLRGVREILRRENPVLAIGTGGYASGPALYAAAGRDIPTAIQEQNAFPGFASRRLASRVRQIHLGFPEARAHLKPGKDTEVLDTGNPIVPPPAIRPDRATAKRRLGFDPDKPLVLSTGGSQGSLAMNQVIAEAVKSGAWPADVQLLWQTGHGSFDQFKTLAGQGRRVTAFLDPIADALAAADLAIGRAGAMTIADITAWELPSILIPLPTAAANHQLGNARAMADAGASTLLEQANLTAGSLCDAVRSLTGDAARMAGMASAAKSRARPDAAHQIAIAALRLVSIS